MPTTNRATKPAMTVKDIKAKTDEKKATVTKAEPVPEPSDEVKARTQATELADGHLREALKKARTATKNLETNTLPLIAKAIVEYLSAKAAFKLAGNKTQVTASIRELRDHCYSLVGYKTGDSEQQMLDANGKTLRTGSTYFEQTVTRGIKAGMLVFEAHKGMTVDDKHGVSAPSNQLAPKLRVKHPTTGKWQEIDNAISDVMPLSIRVIEDEWQGRFGEESKRKPKPKSGDDTATSVEAMAQLIDTGEGGNMSQRLTAIAKFIHAIANVGSPLSPGHLDNLVNIARDVDIILNTDENKAKLGLDESQDKKTA